jgi:hypothetical protein
MFSGWLAKAGVLKAGSGIDLSAPLLGRLLSKPLRAEILSNPVPETSAYFILSL